MPVVKTTDYYGRYEDTEGLKLKKGDQIFVTWPNKTMTREKLIVHEGRDSEQIDMSGGPDRFPTRKLFVSAEIHGLKMLVPLRGLNIEKAGD